MKLHKNGGCLQAMNVTHYQLTQLKAYESLRNIYNNVYDNKCDWNMTTNIYLRIIL